MTGFGDDRDTVFETEYRDGAGTAKLTNYMSKGEQVVRDRAGRPLSDDELEAFNEKAAGKRNRHIIISPANRGELSDRELDRATRRYMSEMTAERPTVDYVYAVHDDKDPERDVHIAMTASDRTDLEMYPNGIRRERKRAHETFREQQRERERTREKQQEREQERQRERENERENEREQDRGLTR